MRIFLGAVACLLLFSCKKGNNDNNGPLNPIYVDTLKFEVLGLEEQSMLQTDTVEVPVEVRYLEGEKDEVTLAVAGLPFTMTAGFYPQLDTPSFFSVIRFVAHDVDTGLYHIKVTAAGHKYARDYYLPIRVLPYPVNPALALVGTYTESGPCTTSGTISHNLSISVVDPYFNKITIRGLWNGSSTINVVADIDPSSNTIVIPSQVSNGTTFTGAGSYSGNQITISYTATSGIFTEQCSTIMTKL